MVNEEVKVWKERPLKEIYPIIYMDCLYTSVRENGRSEKKAVYVALGIDITGKKDVLGFWEGNRQWFISPAIFTECRGASSNSAKSTA